MKKVLIINNALDKGYDGFVMMLKKEIPCADVIHYTEISKHAVDKFDAVILSGCPVDDARAVDREIPHYKFLKTAKNKVMGICVGHQLIARIFGSTIIHKKEKEMGYYTVYNSGEDPILKDVPSKFKAYKLHTDSVALPDNFLLLAHSRKCRVQIMKHNKKPIYGLQFHPEKTKEGKKILKNFINL